MTSFHTLNTRVRHFTHLSLIPQHAVSRESLPLYMSESLTRYTLRIRFLPLNLRLPFRWKECALLRPWQQGM